MYKMKSNVQQWLFIAILLLAGGLFTYEVLLADDYQVNSNEKTSISFSKEEIDLSTIQQGIPKEIKVEIENTGHFPLVIYDVETSCGCTNVDWDSKPIKPGNSATLKISYDAKETGRFVKTVTVYGNFELGTRSIIFKGIVE